MRSIARVKYTGVAGAILMLLGTLSAILSLIIPQIKLLAPASGILGSFCLAIALYQIANTCNDREIFDRFMTGFYIGLACIATLSLILLLYLPKDKGAYEVVLGFSLVLLLPIIYITSVVVAYFYSQSYKLIGKHFNRTLFNEAGNFIFWGVIAAVVVIGFIFIILGQVILIRAFFSLPDALSA